MSIEWGRTTAKLIAIALVVIVALTSLGATTYAEVAPNVSGVQGLNSAQAANHAQAGNTTDLRITQMLDQGWKFIQSDSLTDQEALRATGNDWETVNLPHTWNAKDAASLHSEDYKRGLGWYRLEFATPTQGTRHWLEFGAASLVADVWLNGTKLGEHKGGFTAFRFDITDRLAKSGPNVLLVKVNNRAPKEETDVTAIAPLGGDFNISGGLYRYVSLVSTADPVHFDLADMGGPGVYATTTALSNGSATVNVRARVKSDSGQDGDYRVRISLVGDNGQVVGSAEQTVRMTAGGNQEVVQNLSVSNPHLWQGVADPYLYRLVADLITADGTAVDRVVQNFGIRQERFDPNQGFFLNGQHLRLNGVAMHQDLLGKGWALAAQDWDNSFNQIREIGANAVRLGHYPFPQYALDKADQLGLVVWAETPLGLRTTVSGCRATPTDQFVGNAKQQLQELIRQQYNHAAIAMWAIGNETEARQSTCDPPYDNVTPVLRQMNTTAKREDPSRPTTYAEFTEDVTKSDPFPMGGITDLLATNRYYLWYKLEFGNFPKLLDALRARYPNQPLGISEYGAGAALTHHSDNPMAGPPELRSAPEGEVTYEPEEYANYVHEQVYPVILSKGYLWGSFVWNMFDFGTAHRNEGDVLGVNTKGLMTFDHQTRKDDFYYYKANWSSQPVLYITSRRYTDRAYQIADVTVYSNADSVTLTVNGSVAGTMTANQCQLSTCVFRGVRLGLGTNIVAASGNRGGTPLTDSVTWTVRSPDVNIAAGRVESGYVSSTGARFGSDYFYTGGEGHWIESGDVRGGVPKIENTKDPMLYKFFRRGTFSYQIPLSNGTYTVTLGFMESNKDIKEGERVFDVTANGKTVLNNFDVLKAAGDYRRAVTHTFTVQVTGGRLDLGFNPSKGNAIISNISIRK